MLNRSLALLKPKQPFFTWLAALPEPVQLTLEEFAEDSPAYLIQEYEDDEGQQVAVETFFDVLFEEVLSDWWTIQKDWPKGRNAAMFHEWFDIEHHSLVVDLVSEPLSRD